MFGRKALWLLGALDSSPVLFPAHAAAAYLAAAADDRLAVEGGEAPARGLSRRNGAPRGCCAVQVRATIGVGAGQHVDVGGAAGAAGAFELVGRQVYTGAGVAVVCVVHLCG